jgi:hypothetical protein
MVKGEIIPVVVMRVAGGFGFSFSYKLAKLQGRDINEMVYITYQQQDQDDQFTPAPAAVGFTCFHLLLS